MTIAQLIEELLRHPPETRVFEERKGELRELRAEDVRWSPTGIGDPMEDDAIACVSSWADEETEGGVDGPIIVFSSWG